MIGVRWEKASGLKAYNLSSSQRTLNSWCFDVLAHWCHGIGKSMLSATYGYSIRIGTVLQNFMEGKIGCNASLALVSCAIFWSVVWAIIALPIVNNAALSPSVGWPRPGKACFRIWLWCRIKSLSAVGAIKWIVFEGGSITGWPWALVTTLPCEAAYNQLISAWYAGVLSFSSNSGCKTCHTCFMVYPEASKNNKVYQDGRNT